MHLMQVHFIPAPSFCLRHAAAAYTTPAIFEEVKHIKKSYGAIEALLESDNLQIVNSDRKNIEKVVACGKRDRRYCETLAGRHFNNCPCATAGNCVDNKR